MEKTDKQKLDAIYYEIVGEPEFNRKGIRKQLDENTQDIKEIKDNGVKIKWFWMGGAAAAGATGGILGKGSLAKAMTAIGTFFAGK